jgi:hypothetical protein
VASFSSASLYNSYTFPACILSNSYAGRDSYWPTECAKFGPFLIRTKGARCPKTFVGHYKISEFAHRPIRSTPMMDVAVLAIGLVFFALSIAYVYACDLL